MGDSGLHAHLAGDGTSPADCDVAVGAWVDGDAARRQLDGAAQESAWFRAGMREDAGRLLAPPAAVFRREDRPRFQVNRLEGEAAGTGADGNEVLLETSVDDCVHPCPVGLGTVGRACGLRNIADAGYIAPDGDPEAKYFEERIRNNIAEMTARMCGPPEYNKMGFWMMQGAAKDLTPTMESAAPPANWTAADFDDQAWTRLPGPFFPSHRGHAYCKEVDDAGYIVFEGTYPSLAAICLRGKTADCGLPIAD